MLLPNRVGAHARLNTLPLVCRGTPRHVIKRRDRRRFGKPTMKEQGCQVRILRRATLQCIGLSAHTTLTGLCGVHMAALASLSALFGAPFEALYSGAWLGFLEKGLAPVEG